jgi:hypothetical protein
MNRKIYSTPLFLGTVCVLLLIAACSGSSTHKSNNPVNTSNNGISIKNPSNMPKSDIISDTSKGNESEIFDICGAYYKYLDPYYANRCVLAKQYVRNVFFPNGMISSANNPFFDTVNGATPIKLNAYHTYYSHQENVENQKGKDCTDWTINHVDTYEHCPYWSDPTTGPWPNNYMPSNTKS